MPRNEPRSAEQQASTLNEVSLKINVDAASSTGLSISSKLLSLATSITAGD